MISVDGALSRMFSLLRPFCDIDHFAICFSVIVSRVSLTLKSTASLRACAVANCLLRQCRNRELNESSTLTDNDSENMDTLLMRVVTVTVSAREKEK